MVHRGVVAPDAHETRADGKLEGSVARSLILQRDSGYFYTIAAGCFLVVD